MRPPWQHLSSVQYVPFCTGFWSFHRYHYQLISHLLQLSFAVPVIHIVSMRSMQLSELIDQRCMRLKKNGIDRSNSSSLSHLCSFRLPDVAFGRSLPFAASLNSKVRFEFFRYPRVLRVGCFPAPRHLIPITISLFLVSDTFTEL